MGEKRTSHTKKVEFFGQMILNNSQQIRGKEKDCNRYGKNTYPQRPQRFAQLTNKNHCFILQFHKEKGQVEE